MHPLPFLTDFIVILAAAVAIIFASRPLKLPSVVGFLITGMLIGPSGLNFVQSRGQVEIFAELGVVMLLFFVGLEFSLAHLRAISRQFFGGGTLQIASTIVAVAAISLAASFENNQAVFFGCLVALSSTAIVLKILADRSELDTPHGKLSVGILLFQDFAIVPMIVLTPLLAGQHGISISAVLTRLALSVAAVGGIFLVARFLMPPVLHHIARTRVREAFLMMALLVCLMMAALTASLGFSLALGAFIAGLIISESEYSHEVVAEIVSFRDLFASLFFISVGMLLDLSVVLGQPLVVFGVGAGIFLLKAGVVFAIALSLKLSFRTAVIAAFSLAQIGEFSFVLAKVGQGAGLVNEDLFQYFLSASIFTMLVTPPLVAFAPAVAERTQNVPLFRRFRPEGPPIQTAPLRDHVVIVGYGVNGRNVARVLRETGIPYVIVETDGDIVRQLRKEGLPTVLGDVTRKEILQQCEIKYAKLMVFAISDPRATRTAVRLARGLNPHLHILVRTRLVSEVDELTRLGANEVIPEEFETSVEIFTRVLDHYRIPRNIINAQIKVIRDENYSMLRGLPKTAHAFERISQLLAAGTADTFLVLEDQIGAGASLQELALHERTGASVLAVVRGDKPVINPTPDFCLLAADTVVLVGSHASVDKAFEFLSQPAPRDLSAVEAKQNSGGTA